MRNLSFGDLVDVASEVAEELRICEESIAVSESAAGGLVNASLVAVPGASDFYLGGMVVYTSASRALLAQNDPSPKACAEPLRHLLSSRHGGPNLFTEPTGAWGRPEQQVHQVTRMVILREAAGWLAAVATKLPFL